MEMSATPGQSTNIKVPTAIAVSSTAYTDGAEDEIMDTKLSPGHTLYVTRGPNGYLSKSYGADHRCFRPRNISFRPIFEKGGRTMGSWPRISGTTHDVSYINVLLVVYQP